MKLFKKKVYKYLGHAPRKFQHRVSPIDEVDVRICAVCGEKIMGKIFYCPVCRKYYGLECVVHAIGGFTCPHCKEISFLQTVKITSR